MTAVTVIGLGLMGQALAGAFVRGGQPTTVWNRTGSKADELVALGAERKDTVAEAVAASPLVVVCVSDYDAVYELLDGVNLTGRVLVNLTSGTSTQAREAAGRLDTTYLDGAIMAVPQAIGTDDAVLLYSGPKESFDNHEATLRNLGPVSYLGADHGLSSLYDVAALGVMWSVLNGFLQGAALLGTANVDASTFAPFVNPLIHVITGWITDYAKQIDDGAYPAFDSTIDTHLGAMDHLAHESKELGINAELPELIKRLGDRAVAAGLGGNGYAALIEVFRKA